MAKMANYVQHIIPANHLDLIHDVSYDFYGRRMATCSSDQSVQVWDLDSDNEWRCISKWKAHAGAIWRVTWAHPEFGQVLATCSFDRTVHVWEEQAAEDVSATTHWSKRASLVDSRTSVTDVKFSPKQLGLLLATCSIDGQIRIYEAPDVMNLSQWSLIHQIVCKQGTGCLSWNPSSVSTPLLAVGSNDVRDIAGTAVQLFEFSEASKKWIKVQNLPGVDGPVRDIAFAPNPGRSYHLLAVAAKEVYIVQLIPTSNGGGETGGQTKFDVRHPGHFDDHNSQVWRVAWNATGTVLASSGDDGHVRLWKANYMQAWSCFADIPGATKSKSGPSQSSFQLQDPSHQPKQQSFSSSIQLDQTSKALREFNSLA